MFDIGKLMNDLRAGSPQVESIPDVTEAFAFVPAGNGAMQLMSLKQFHDEWRDAPERASGTATALTLESFIALVNRHKDNDSVVFADIIGDAPSLTAIIDYRRKEGDPRFQRHRVHYAYPVAEEWTAWKEQDGDKLSQSDFAAWVEEHIHEIGDPEDFADRETVEALFRGKMATPADLFTLSRGLKISADISVKEVRDLASGQAQIAFEETHKDGEGAPLKVPQLFLVRVPFFVSQPAATLVARLRYRLHSGKIVWHYELWRWRDAMQVALIDDLRKVREQTNLDLFEGCPES